MNKEMQIIREVNTQAEEFYGEAQDLGNHAAYALKAIHRSQMTGLESIAESSFKTSDILDYIKKQTARFDYWRLSYPNDRSGRSFGERLKNYLEIDLAQRRDVICRRLTISDKSDADRQERRRIHLLLMRQFIRQMVVQYEYGVSLESRRRGS